MLVREQIKSVIFESIIQLSESQQLKVPVAFENSSFAIESVRKSSAADFSSAVCLRLTNLFSMPAPELAQVLAPIVEAKGDKIFALTLSPNGFLNFSLKFAALQAALSTIVATYYEPGEITAVNASSSLPDRMLQLDAEEFSRDHFVQIVYAKYLCQSFLQRLTNKRFDYLNGTTCPSLLESANLDACLLELASKPECLGQLDEKKSAEIFALEKKQVILCCTALDAIDRKLEKPLRLAKFFRLAESSKNFLKNFSLFSGDTANLRTFASIVYATMRILALVKETISAETVSADF